MEKKYVCPNCGQVEFSAIPAESYECVEALCSTCKEHHRAAAAALGSIKSPRKAATSRENGKKGGRPRGINLATLIDRYGANGVIRIDAGNGSAGPTWIEWDKEIAKEFGKIKMYRVNKNQNAYQDGDANKSQSVMQAAKYVIHDYSCDDNTMYTSAWIEDDDRNAPYQAQNPYRYRLIF